MILRVVSVKLDQVSKIFVRSDKSLVHALDHLELEVNPGELLILLGPSGCGKTSALRLIAGLENPSSGSVQMEGKSMAQVLPQDRKVAMVFQSDALYPHMTAYQNMAFGLKLRGLSKSETDSIVIETASLLEVSHCLKQLPETLSGGERKRVALGRATVLKPDVFLLDEPLSNLEPDLRSRLRFQIKQLHRKLGCTVILVTHDQAEALSLGDRIAVMKAGRILQVGIPSEVYRRPANVFVAQFLGMPPMNLIQGFLERKGPDLVFTESDESNHGFQFSLSANSQLLPDGMDRRGVVLGFRPENGVLCSKDHPKKKGDVELVSCDFLGFETIWHVRTLLNNLVIRRNDEPSFEVGSKCGFQIPSEAMVWFDLKTGQAIPHLTGMD